MFDKRFNMESFGNDCPVNYDEICQYLNDIVDKWVDDNVDMSSEWWSHENEVAFSEAMDTIWEKYWRGEYPDAPAPSEELL